MSVKPIKGPLFDALVVNAIAREDVVNNAADRARGSRDDVIEAVMGAASMDAAVDAVLQHALACALPDVRAGGKLIARELATEAAALKKEDPRTLPPLRDVDVAAKRAAMVQKREGDTGNGEGSDT